MKKKFFLILTLCIACNLAACGSTVSDTQQTQTSTESTTEDVVSTEPLVPIDVLTTIWDNTSDDNRFTCYGGNMSNPVDNAPGAFDLSDTDALTYSYLVPEDMQSNISQAATLTHMMNANTFTGAALSITNISSTEMAQALQDAILNNQFMCGFPERLIILTDKDFVLYAFGDENFVSSFCDTALTNYNQLEVFYDQPM